MITMKARPVGASENLDPELSEHLRLMLKAEQKWKTVLSAVDLPVLEDMRARDIKGAHELIKLIDRHTEIEIWCEYP